MPSTLNGDTVECSVPTSAQLPEASSETGIELCDFVSALNCAQYVVVTAV
jgi:hypothetical protein